MSFNKYIKILTLLVLPVLLQACRHDETPQGPQKGESVRLEAEIAKTSADLSKATPSTDVSGGEFEVNDEFGFFLKSKAGYVLGNSNVKYVASKSAENKMLYTSDAPMFYYDYDLHAIYGYYPYVTTVTSGIVDFTLKSDQRGNSTSAPKLSNYTLSDLMWTSKSGVKPQTKFEDALKLTFDHKLSNIIVTLKNRTDATFSGSIPRVWLRNVANKVSLNVETGVVAATAGDVVDIELAPFDYLPAGGYVEATTTEIHYRAIAVPQSFAGGTAVLKVNTNNVTYQVKTTAALVFETGKQHQLNVTNSGVDFRLSGCSVNEWGSKVEVNGGTIGGDGVLPCTMLFNAAGATAGSATKAVLNIDGVSYNSTEVKLTDGILKVTYDQGASWGNKLISVAFYDNANNEINTDKQGQTLNWEIIGDPTNAAYSTIIGSVTFN